MPTFLLTAEFVCRENRNPLVEETVMITVDRSGGRGLYYL
jgi:hypothetical protein